MQIKYMLPSIVTMLLVILKMSLKLTVVHSTICATLTPFGIYGDVYIHTRTILTAAVLRGIYGNVLRIIHVQYLLLLSYRECMEMNHTYCFCTTGNIWRCTILTVAVLQRIYRDVYGSYMYNTYCYDYYQ